MRYLLLFLCELCIENVDVRRCGLFFSRIRTERNGGAWCPKQPISRDTYEWLEIDLQELKVVTQVETQGRFGYGQVRFILLMRFFCVCHM